MCPRQLEAIRRRDANERYKNETESPTFDYVIFMYIIPDMLLYNIGSRRLTHRSRDAR